MPFLPRLLGGCLVTITLLAAAAAIGGYAWLSFGGDAARRASWSAPLDGVGSLALDVHLVGGGLSVGPTLPAGPPPPAGTALTMVSSTPRDADLTTTWRVTDGAGTATVDRGVHDLPDIARTELLGASPATFDVALTAAVPATLDIEVGTGDVDLDLRALPVPRFDVTVGQGDVSVTLPATGTPDGPSRVRVGFGDVNLVVPPGLPVRIAIAGGSDGTTFDGFAFDGQGYTTTAWARLADPSTGLEVTLEHGAGAVRLEQLVAVEPFVVPTATATATASGEGDIRRVAFVRTMGEPSRRASTVRSSARHP